MPTWIEKEVPAELRIALGDLIIAAGHLEYTIYEVADIFRINSRRSRSTKRIVGLVQARAGDLGMPPWTELELGKFVAWCRAASAMMEQRDRLIHASLSFWGSRPVRSSFRDTLPIDSDPEHVRSVVESLIKVAGVGMTIWGMLLFPESPSGPRRGHVIPFYIPALPGLLPRQPSYEVDPRWMAWIEAAAPTSADSRRDDGEAR